MIVNVNRQDEFADTLLALGGLHWLMHRCPLVDFVLRTSDRLALNLDFWRSTAHAVRAASPFPLPLPSRPVPRVPVFCPVPSISGTISTLSRAIRYALLFSTVVYLFLLFVFRSVRNDND